MGGSDSKISRINIFECSKLVVESIPSSRNIKNTTWNDNCDEVLKRYV